MRRVVTKVDRNIVEHEVSQMFEEHETVERVIWALLLETGWGTDTIRARLKVEDEKAEEAKREAKREEKKKRKESSQALIQRLAEEQKAEQVQDNKSSVSGTAADDDDGEEVEEVEESDTKVEEEDNAEESFGGVSGEQHEMKTMELSNEKCRAHGQRYCSESGCCISLVAAVPGTPVSAPNDFEDSLVGRQQVSSPAPAKLTASEPLTIPIPTPTIPIPTPTIPIPTPTISAPTSEPSKLDDSPAALVKASQTYADAVTASEKAVSTVADLQKRLEFARENAADAVNEKDKALQQIKILIEGELNVANG
jgi:hypothetical protein